VTSTDTDVVASIAHELAAQVGELRYNLWFKDNAKLELNDHELVVGVPNLFLQEWLQSNFMLPLRKATESVTGRRVPVRLIVDGEMFRAMRARDEAAEKTSDLPSATPTAQRRQSQRGQTLDNFVVGPSNRMAHAAAVRVAQDPMARFNPLVFYGPLGLGKTHLLRGIFHAVRETHRSLQVVYLTAESFTNMFLENMRAGRLAAFRQKVRGADLLLVDDIHFLASKKATQAELLHTYEALDGEGKQVVLSTDRHPRQIKDFSQELVDRLVAGMPCPLEPACFDTRMAILQAKAPPLGLTLNRELVEFVASHFRANVRELEGALHCLKAHVDVNGPVTDLAEARQALADLLRECTKTVSLRDVEQAVCHTFDLKAEQLRAADRSRDISQPRMLAMYLARKYTESPYGAIGKHFGGRNHSTVMFAERKVQEWIDQTRTVRFAGRPWAIGDAIRAIEQRLK
jgi:chromosomal replication initiator protein